MEMGLLIFGFVILILAIGIPTWLATQNYGKTSTPENIQAIQNTQSMKIQNTTLLNPAKKGLSEIFQSYPEDQRLLINTPVQALRLTGYLGPYDSGVFDEDLATQFALATGARCLILEIDSEQGSTEPVLLYRDGLGYKKSLQSGSIQKVAKSLAERAFQQANDGVPPQMAKDPLFVILYFHRLPSSSSNPTESIRFLGKVAQQLQPLRSMLLGQTPYGDFRRQGMEDKLFFLPTDVFQKRVILMTNVDTTPFRRLELFGLKDELRAENDLDLLVHCRMYSRESPSGLGVTSMPASSVMPAAVITTPAYWLNTPPDRLADAREQTKKVWTLVMKNTASEDLVVPKEEMKKLFEEYGIHAMPFCIFDPLEKTNLFVGPEAPFQKNGWAAKSELLRFIPPKPIVLVKPNPKTDANKGMIFSPSL